MARPKKSMQRRANGEGTLYQSGQYFVFQITLPGEKKRRSFYGRTGEEAVAKKNAALEAMRRDGFLPEKNNYTVSSWCNEWLQLYKSSSMRESGYASYEDNIRMHIETFAIGNILLVDLTSEDVQRWINILSKSGRKQKSKTKSSAKPAGLAPRTVRRVYLVLRQALDKAVALKKIGSNPAAKELVELPRIEKRIIKSFNTEEAAEFFAAIRDDYMYPVYWTDVTTGLRRGEILGLKWKDINFNTQTANIRRQISVIRGIAKEVPYVKTDAGYRPAPLPDDVVAMLKDIKKQQREHKKQLLGEEKVINISRGRDPQAEDYVFSWPDGRFYSPSHAYRRLQRLLAKHGFDAIPLHGLRHSFASLMLQSGVDVATLQNMLGHHDLASTSVYLHGSQKVQHQAANDLSKALKK